MTPVALHAAIDPVYGGKATALAAALRAGLPVPGGFALAPAVVERVVAGHDAARAALLETYGRLAGPAAVRSSCVGEDGAGAAFAGQHATRLHVTDPEALLDAVREVYASASAPAALAYRRRLGLCAAPQMAVVVQRLVDAECAGVVFTRDPITGAHAFVIEATWGLGEAVVAGLVTPDRYRLTPEGEVLEVIAGDKDLAIRCAPGGRTREEAVPAHLALAPCLDARRLARLHALALDCERVFGAARDLEFAFRGDELFLLQCRPITTLERR